MFPPLPADAAGYGHSLVPDGSFGAIVDWLYSALLGSCFVNGLFGLVFELTGLSARRGARLARIVATAVVCLGYVPITLFLRAHVALQVFNAPAIWIPTVIALALALGRARYYLRGIYRRERIVLLTGDDGRS
ncbi:MAG: hypothetical protein ACOCZB_01975 [Spirochaetota bacterium]